MKYKLKLKQVQARIPATGEKLLTPRLRTVSEGGDLVGNCWKDFANASSNRECRGLAPCRNIYTLLQLPKDILSVSTAGKDSNSVLHPSEGSFSAWRALNTAEVTTERWTWLHGARTLLSAGSICMFLYRLFCVFYTPFPILSLYFWETWSCRYRRSTSARVNKGDKNLVLLLKFVICT